MDKKDDEVKFTPDGIKVATAEEKENWTVECKTCGLERKLKVEKCPKCGNKEITTGKIETSGLQNDVEKTPVVFLTPAGTIRIGEGEDKDGINDHSSKDKFIIDRAGRVFKLNIRDGFAMFDKKDRVITNYLTIYLNSGKTLRFENISNLEKEDNIVSFDYISASTGSEQTAAFEKNAIAGLSTNYEDE